MSLFVDKRHGTIIHHVARVCGRPLSSLSIPTPPPIFPLHLLSLKMGREGGGPGGGEVQESESQGVNGEVMMMGGWRSGREKTPMSVGLSPSVSLSLPPSPSLPPSHPRHLRVTPRFSSRQRGVRCERGTAGITRDFVRLMFGFSIFCIFIHLTVLRE